MEIKDMIRATFKQPTNMTSIFLHVIRGRCCRGNSGRNILDFLDSKLQRELFFRSYPFSGGRPDIVLYRISFFSVRPIFEGQRLWIDPRPKVFVRWYYSPADHFVISCFLYGWCWDHSTASESWLLRIINYWAFNMYSAKKEWPVQSPLPKWILFSYHSLSFEHWSFLHLLFFFNTRLLLMWTHSLTWIEE